MFYALNETTPYYFDKTTNEVHKICDWTKEYQVKNKSLDYKGCYPNNEIDSVDYTRGLGRWGHEERTSEAPEGYLMCGLTLIVVAD